MEVIENKRANLQEDKRAKKDKGTQTELAAANHGICYHRMKYLSRKF